MATKVTIIDIELDVDRIVSNDVEELTAESRAKLDVAIDAGLAVKELKDRKEAEKQAVEEVFTKAVQAAIDAIQGAGDAGLAQQAVLELTGPAITKAFALTTRIKNRLKSDGNKFILTNTNGIYKMQEFNTTE